VRLWRRDPRRWPDGERTRGGRRAAGAPRQSRGYMPQAPRLHVACCGCVWLARRSSNAAPALLCARRHLSPARNPSLSFPLLLPPPPASPSLPYPPRSSSSPPPAMPATTAETLSLVTRTVSVAPLVLLSVADHYGRTAKGTRKRVVGVLLGQNDGKNVRVSNSFAGMSSLRRRGSGR